MKPFLLVVAILALAMPAYPTNDIVEEYLELVSLSESTEDGFIVFKGVIRNTHDNLTVNPRAILTFKKDGIVIGVHVAHCKTDPGPGETCDFTEETSYTSSDYDDFSMLLSGWFDQPDPEKLTGSISIVEESLNFTATEEGETLFFGEFFNGTNAVLHAVNVVFRLFDGKDRFLGETTYSIDYFSPVRDIWPNETRAFVVTTEDVPFAKVERWEYTITYAIRRYEASDIPTPITESTWGRIKQRSIGPRSK